eukprot:4296845-Pleurochrysis_carterae.AAC.1
MSPLQSAARFSTRNRGAHWSALYLLTSKTDKSACICTHTLEIGSCTRFHTLCRMLLRETVRAGMTRSCSTACTGPALPAGTGRCSLARMAA